MKITERPIENGLFARDKGDSILVWVYSSESEGFNLDRTLSCEPSQSSLPLRKRFRPRVSAEANE